MFSSKINLVFAIAAVFVFVAGFSIFLFARASDITPENIITLINQQRIANGLPPVSENQSLDRAAMAKSADMLARNYFDHYAFGMSPWLFILQAGYDYSTAGENLAKGFSSSEQIVDAWMNSPEHRANILNPNFTDIGVGVVRGVTSGQASATTFTTEMLAAPQIPINQFFQTLASAFLGIFAR